MNVRFELLELQKKEIILGIIHKWCHGFTGRGSAICDALLNWKVSMEKT
jgi:hypothetical protein